MSPTRTNCAIATFLVAVGIIILIRLNQLNFVGAYSRIAVSVMSLFACFGFFGAIQGGSTLDIPLRQLRRWRGPFIPLWTQRIPFESIKNVNIGPGMRPGSVQPARQYDYSYHVAILRDNGALAVRWTKSLDDARHYAGLIADVVGCPLEENLEMTRRWTTSTAHTSRNDKIH